MKKKFKLEDLDCANCAAKMEEAIKKIPGVNDADIGEFLNTAMDARYDKGADEAVAADSAAVEEMAAVDSVAAW